MSAFAHVAGLRGLRGDTQHRAMPPGAHETAAATGSRSLPLNHESAAQSSRTAGRQLTDKRRRCQRSRFVHPHARLGLGGCQKESRNGFGFVWSAPGPCAGKQLSLWASRGRPRPVLTQHIHHVKTALRTGPVGIQPRLQCFSDGCPAIVADGSIACGQARARS